MGSGTRTGVGSVRRAAALKVFWQAVRGAGGGPGMGARLRAVPRMLGQGLRGRYPHLDRGRLALAVGGLLYVLSPVDAVPDLLPLLGLGDDAVVAAFVVRTVLSEVDAFLDWERHRARTVDGEVLG